MYYKTKNELAFQTCTTLPNMHLSAHIHHRTKHVRECPHVPQYQTWGVLLYMISLITTFFICSSLIFPTKFSISPKVLNSLVYMSASPYTDGLHSNEVNKGHKPVFSTQRIKAVDPRRGASLRLVPTEVWRCYQVMARGEAWYATSWTPVALQLLSLEDSGNADSAASSSIVCGSCTEEKKPGFIISGQTYGVWAWEPVP